MAREAVAAGRIVTGQRGQLFKQESGSWGYRYRDPHTGKRPQKSGYATKGEARQALDRHIERLRLGGQYRPGVTVGTICDAFFAGYQADPSTVEWMTYHRGKIEAMFKKAKADDLDAAEIAAWRNALTNKGSAHQTLAVFRQVLGAAVGWGWITRNAAGKVPNAKPRRKAVEFFESWAVVEMIAAELGTARDGGAIALVGAGTGLRPEELFGLDWSDIDLKRRVLTVQRVYAKTAKGRVEIKPYGKTDGSTRAVPLRARVVDAFREIPGRRSGAVFQGRDGARVLLNNWRDRNWDPAIEAAGLPKVGEERHPVPYSLRHTYAAWSLRAGVNIYALAQRMGTSVLQIQKTYGHLTSDADDYERTLLDAWDIAGDVVIADADGRGLDVSLSHEEG